MSKFISIKKIKQFEKDLTEKGQPGEDLYYDYLLSLNPDTSTNLYYFNKDKKCDIIHHNLLNGVTTTHEVKTDYQVFDYTLNKNMFVEFWSQGGNSGVLTTTADYWVNIFYNLNQIWITTPQDIEYIVNEYNHIKFNPGYKYDKDTGELESKGYLIPIDDDNSCSDILDRFTIIQL